MTRSNGLEFAAVLLPIPYHHSDRSYKHECLDCNARPLMIIDSLCGFTTLHCIAKYNLCDWLECHETAKSFEKSLQDIVKSNIMQCHFPSSYIPCSILIALMAFLF